jgi:hypothetical protein
MIKYGNEMLVALDIGCGFGHCGLIVESERSGEKPAKTSYINTGS